MWSKICVLSAVTALSVVALSAETASAQSAKWDLLSPDRRIDAMVYGLSNVCLPAQAAGVDTGDFIRSNRNSVNVRRVRSFNESRERIWEVDGEDSVAVIESENGCTVSTGFEIVDRDKFTPALVESIGAGAQSRVLEEWSDETGAARTLYCIPNDTGQPGGIILSEVTRQEAPDVGRRRPVDVLYVSLLVPPTSFCASSTDEAAQAAD